tara:strand:+ start:172 stop:312 length:141 start_codon:yes stop_codon:yes gene_type:complete
MVLQPYLAVRLWENIRRDKNDLSGVLDLKTGTHFSLLGQAQNIPCP